MFKYTIVDGDVALWNFKFAWSDNFLKIDVVLCWKSCICRVLKLLVPFAFEKLETGSLILFSNALLLLSPSSFKELSFKQLLFVMDDLVRFLLVSIFIFL